MGWLEDVRAQGQDYAMTGTLLWIGIMAGEPIVSWSLTPTSSSADDHSPTSSSVVYPSPSFCALPWSFGQRYVSPKSLKINPHCPLPLSLTHPIFNFSLTHVQLAFGLAFSFSIPPVWGIRFLLGFFESTFGPCLLSITVQWYTKEEQPFASATWQMMLGLASSIVGFLPFQTFHAGLKTSYTCSHDLDGSIRCKFLSIMNSNMKNSKQTRWGKTATPALNSMKNTVLTFPVRFLPHPRPRSPRMAIHDDYNRLYQCNLHRHHVVLSPRLSHPRSIPHRRRKDQIR